MNSPSYIVQLGLAVFQLPSSDIQYQMNHIKDFFFKEDGVTAIEYGLIATLIAATIFVGVSAVGSQVNVMYSSVSNKVSAIIR